MFKLNLLLFLTLAACATSKREKEIAMEDWRNRQTSELDSHPYFKHLPVKKIKHANGIETWFLREQNRFQSDSYCQNLGGCQTLPIYNCDNIFSVKDGIILKFEQNGGCPGYKTIEAKKKSKE